jgi:hypothetical protein
MVIMKASACSRERGWVGLGMEEVGEKEKGRVRGVGVEGWRWM